MRRIALLVLVLLTNSCSDGTTVGNDNNSNCEPGRCGTFEARDCGLCPGAKEACAADNRCYEVCEDRNCGEPWPGISCGECSARETCDQVVFRCVDVCEDRECSEPLPGIVCGECLEPEGCSCPAAPPRRSTTP
jgi:hypothetical protein